MDSTCTILGSPVPSLFDSSLSNACWAQIMVRMLLHFSSADGGAATAMMSGRSSPKVLNLAATVLGSFASTCLLPERVPSQASNRSPPYGRAHAVALLPTHTRLQGSSGASRLSPNPSCRGSCPRTSPRRSGQAFFWESAHNVANESHGPTSNSSYQFTNGKHRLVSNPIEMLRGANPPAMARPQATSSPTVRNESDCTKQSDNCLTSI